LTEKSLDFSCNLKNLLYNVDIRERERGETKMRMGDKVFVRIQHMTANGVIVDLDRTQDGVDYLVKVGDGEYWIPEKDCTSVEALDKWSAESTTR
jgi:ribosomal protein S1